MNSTELKVERVRKKLTQRDMAKAIGKTTEAYAKKEQGKTACSDEEKIQITRILGLDFQRFNHIFFGGQLPNW